MRVLEVAGFLTLSGALHVAALTFAPIQSGGSGGGDSGQADITMQAATPTLAAMVAEWTRPPDVSDSPTLQQPSVQAAPNRLTALSPVAKTHAPKPPAQANAPDMPSAETRLPAPLIPLATVAAPNLPTVQTPQTSTLAPPRPTIEQTPRAPLMQPTAQPLAQLPQVDTAPPTSRLAPTHSARPEPRPDRPKQVAQPKPKQTNAQTAKRPAQVAKGAGQQRATAQAAARKAPVASGPSKAQLAQAQAQWGARIRNAVARAQRYPNGTRAKGTVKLQIAVSSSGRVAGISIVRSSGDRRLDQAAVTAVKRARLPRAPKELTAGSYRFNLPLTFQR